MRQHEFEELWLRRDELNETLRAEVEQFARSDSSAKAFVEGGWKVHQLFRQQPGAVADSGLAYRMKVYATNHMDDVESVSERGAWLRWPAVTSGLVAGAMVVLFAFGPFTSSVAPVAEQSEGAPEAIEQTPAAEAPVPETQLADEEAPAQRGDSSAVDQAGPRVRQEQPDWDLRLVGTSDE